LLSSSVFSQSSNYTLSKDFLWGVDRYYNDKDQSVQTFVKPYSINQIAQIKDSSVFFPISKVKRRSAEKMRFEVNPLVLAQGGVDFSSGGHAVREFGIGADANVQWKEKLAFNFKAFFGQGTYNRWMDSIIQASRVMPGMGYAYNLKKDSLHSLYAYQYFSGYLSYSPNKIFNFQVGRDKQFWGDGYRSLFLSDVAAPYPYLKITTNVWHFTYVNLFTAMKDATNTSGLKKDWVNKYATFHYLGWNATKRINFGLFESIVWQGSETNRQRGYDINYLNPVIFFRPIEYSLGSSDNAFLGLSTKIKLFKKQQLYGQLLFDEFYLKEMMARTGWWANKFAFQLGFKSFDLFNVKDLHFQTEFNYVRPYTYSHGSELQNYGQMNQALAHPLGANFMESGTFLNYRRKHLFFELKCLYAIYGADSANTDYGKNIFLPYANRVHDYHNFVGQGIKTTLTTASFRVEYVPGGQKTTKLELGVIERIEKTSFYTKQTPYIYLGIKTDFVNLYNDF
jgi:hypothetical protein